MFLRECRLCGMKFEDYSNASILEHLRTQHSDNLMDPTENIIDKSGIGIPLLRKQLHHFFRSMNPAYQ